MPLPGRRNARERRETAMADMRSLRPAAPILIGAAVMLSLSMGIRQSLGLVMPSLTRDIAISVSEFTLALSVQNLFWGALQPFAGALVVRLGFRSLCRLPSRIAPRPPRKPRCSPP